MLFNRHKYSRQNILDARFLKIPPLYQPALWIPLFTILLFTSFEANAGNRSQGHMISVKIANCKDTLFYLNHYSVQGIMNDDTAGRSPEGRFVFQGPDKLEAGMYFVSSNVNNRYFDFFITNEQYLTFDFELKNVIRTMKTSGSDENRKYFNSLLAMQSNLSPKNFVYSDSVQFLINHANFSDSTMQHLIGKSGPDLSFAEKYIRACISPAVFQQNFLPTNIKNKPDPTRFFLDHFFDNLDFSDYLLAGTPVFTNRIDAFIDTITSLHIDPLQAEVDRLLALSSANKKTEEYVIWHLMSWFDTYYFLPEYDALYIHMVNDFLETGKVAWFYPEVKAREFNEVKKRETLLDGKVGPNLEMRDTSGVFQQLYSVKSKYTLLLFWASTCSHCRDEMPAFIKFYNDFHQKYNLEIFGVSTDTSMTRWKSYVRRHKLPWVNVYGRKGILGNYHELYYVQSTPTLFLLDDKKKIIAKYLTPAEFSEIIINREKLYNKK